MQVNQTPVVDRNNRPNVSQRVGLRTFFINDGEYVDPYEISSVQIFKTSDTLSPNSVLGAENLVTSVPLMAFAASGTNILNQAVHCTITAGTDPGTACENAFDVDNYIPGVTASGIYRMAAGEYVVVLDQTLNLSGWDWSTDTQVAASSCSSVGDYTDIWTVKLAEASKYQVIYNQYALHENTFYAVTEPLMLTSRAKLLNKHVRYNEVIDLKVVTENTLQNKTIPQSIQNIFKDSVVTTASIVIKKVNQDPTFDGPFTVVSTDIDQITSDNTLLFSWDVATTIETAAGVGTNFGSPTGTYSVQVTYSILNQQFVSPLSYLTVS
jgi:hypothetical protein